MLLKFAFFLTIAIFVTALVKYSGKEMGILIVLIALYLANGIWVNKGVTGGVGRFQQRDGTFRWVTW